MRQPHTTASPIRSYLSRMMIMMLALVLVSAQPMAVVAAEEPASEQTAATTTASTPDATPPSNVHNTQPTNQPVAKTDVPPQPAAPSPDKPASPPAQPKPPTGPKKPTGADAPSYNLNKETGLWESDKYTWDPVTKQTKPKDQPAYSYNPATGMWDTKEWRYDAPSGKYIENQRSVAELPANAKVAPTSAPEATSRTAASPLALEANSRDNANDDTRTDVSNDSKGIFDLFYDAAISNDISTGAFTGDAIIDKNTWAGNAISGTANAIANIINTLQSSWSNLQSGKLATFVSNMFGNIFGDLLIDPGHANSTSASLSDTTKINSSSSTKIDNQIDVAAGSGNAAVTNNTQAGNATSGEATAMANVINSIASSINAGQSFLGVLNIFGNLNGDILLPTQLANLLKGGNDTAAAASKDTSIKTTTNQAISNNVTSSAVSGQAVVDNNTEAGNAKSGDTESIVNVLNLTGREIVGQNALLVFVNVLGNWMGLIVDAPAGAKSAALGDPNATSTTKALATGSAEVDSTDNQTINNDVSLKASSGNATVANNTNAGNATSGDATTIANIANITQSTLSLTNWFGVLFINIFGDWTGSFGIDTKAGEAAKPAREQKHTKPALHLTSTTRYESSSGSGFDLANASGSFTDSQSSLVPTARFANIASKYNNEGYVASLATAEAPANLPISSTPNHTTFETIPEFVGYLSLVMSYLGARLLFRNEL